ncbi:MAG: hypothetical protein AAFO84_12430, partial [Cyanobacteria bacterium J06598_1]
MYERIQRPSSQRPERSKPPVQTRQHYQTHIYTSGVDKESDSGNRQQLDSDQHNQAENKQNTQANNNINYGTFLGPDNRLYEGYELYLQSRGYSSVSTVLFRVVAHAGDPSQVSLVRVGGQYDGQVVASAYAGSLFEFSNEYTFSVFVSDPTLTNDTQIQPGNVIAIEATPGYQITVAYSDLGQYIAGLEAQAASYEHSAIADEYQTPEVIEETPYSDQIPEYVEPEAVIDDQIYEVQPEIIAPEVEEPSGAPEQDYDSIDSENEQPSEEDYATAQNAPITDSRLETHGQNTRDQDSYARQNEVVLRSRTPEEHVDIFKALLTTAALEQLADNREAILRYKEHYAHRDSDIDAVRSHVREEASLAEQQQQRESALQGLEGIRSQAAVEESIQGIADFNDELTVAEEHGLDIISPEEATARLATGEDEAEIRRLAEERVALRRAQPAVGVLKPRDVTDNRSDTQVRRRIQIGLNKILKDIEQVEHALNTNDLPLDELSQSLISTAINALEEAGRPHGEAFIASEKKRRARIQLSSFALEVGLTIGALCASGGLALVLGGLGTLVGVGNALYEFETADDLNNAAGASVPGGSELLENPEAASRNYVFAWANLLMAGIDFGVGVRDAEVLVRQAVRSANVDAIALIRSEDLGLIGEILRLERVGDAAATSRAETLYIYLQNEQGLSEANILLAREAIAEMQRVDLPESALRVRQSSANTSAPDSELPTSETAPVPQTERPPTRQTPKNPVAETSPAIKQPDGTTTPNRQQGTAVPEEALAGGQQSESPVPETATSETVPSGATPEAITTPPLPEEALQQLDATFADKFGVRLTPEELQLASRGQLPAQLSHRQILERSLDWNGVKANFLGYPELMASLLRYRQQEMTRVLSRFQAL